METRFPAFKIISLLNLIRTVRVQWTKTLGAPSKVSEARGVATDSSSNVFATGLTTGGIGQPSATGLQDMFLAKYDSMGVRKFVTQLGVTSNATSGFGVSMDSSGNAYVGGSTTGGLDGNTKQGTQDFFITKYDNSGAKQWTSQLGVTLHVAQGNAMATNSRKEVFITGFVNRNLDGNTLTSSQDFFISKYDKDGNKK